MRGEGEKRSGQDGQERDSKRRAEKGENKTVIKESVEEGKKSRVTFKQIRGNIISSGNSQ